MRHEGGVMNNRQAGRKSEPERSVVVQRQHSHHRLRVRSSVFVFLAALILFAAVSSANATARSATLETSLWPYANLQRGDILLERHEDTFADLIDTLYHGYWTHAFIYVGSGGGRHMVVEATGPGALSREISLEKRLTESGGMADDWAVLRVNRGADLGGRAAHYAVANLVDRKYAPSAELVTAFALEFNPLKPVTGPAMYLALSRGSKAHVYCSSLVWQAWKRGADVDIDSNQVKFALDNAWAIDNYLYFKAMPKSHYVLPDEIWSEHFEHPWAMRIVARRAKTPGRIAFVRDGDIWTMKSDGSDQKNLTRSPSIYDYAPSWSPSRAKIAFIKVLGPTGFSARLRIMDADGSHVTSVPLDIPGQGVWATPLFTDCAWSPDGKRLVLTQGSGGGMLHSRLLLANLATHTVSRLYDPGWGEVHNASWRPDGKRVMTTYTMSSSVAPSTVCVNVSTRERVALPPFWVPDERLGYLVKSAVWSPEGSELAYVPTSDKHMLPDFETLTDVVTMPVAGGSHTLLDSYSSVQSAIGLGIAWSRDGSKLVYEVYGPMGSDDPPQLRIVDAVSGQVSAVVANAQQPSWDQ
jgi:hypothetical protein